MTRLTITSGLALGLMLLTGCASTEERSATSVVRPIWTLEKTLLNPTPGKLDVSTFEHLTWADAYRNQILTVEEARTIENTLVSFNRLLMHLEAAHAQAELFVQVHPAQSVRREAEKSRQKIEARMAELWLDEQVYAAIRAIDAEDADRPARFFIEKILRKFERAGVNQHPPIRSQMIRLGGEIAGLRRDFHQNLRSSARAVRFEARTDLVGIPEEWIASHPADRDGKIDVSVTDADYMLFMANAVSPDVRRTLYTQANDRGYPQNAEVLEKSIARRNQLAQLHGYANWADYAVEGNMATSAVEVQTFIDRIARAAKAAADTEYGVLLARKRRVDPDAVVLASWEKDYYINLVRWERYGFDPEDARPYLNFDQVLQGLFDITSRLFGIEYRSVDGLEAWHADVTAWDLYEDSRPLGRIYLDLHPRRDKQPKAACFRLRGGIVGECLPQAVLVAGLPDPAKTPDGVALMGHEDVVALFREFACALHHVLGGQRKWVAHSSRVTEQDFAAVFSHLFEHWCWDVDVLQSFARHHETGEPIPAELVRQMNRAHEFGRGIRITDELFLAALSLRYCTWDPMNLDSTQLLKEVQERYSPFAHAEGTHAQCGLSHFVDAPGLYYADLWSQAVAMDLLTRFDREGLLDVKTAREFRRKVLTPGGSRRAGEMVKDFVGRPYSFEAFETRLAK
jgi:thimet oligopeptidase